jgi:hypothetical protein
VTGTIVPLKRGSADEAAGGADSRFYLVCLYRGSFRIFSPPLAASLFHTIEGCSPGGQMVAGLEATASRASSASWSAVMGNFLARAWRLRRLPKSLARLYIGAPRARVGCDLAPGVGTYHWLRRTEQSLGVVVGFIHHQVPEGPRRSLAGESEGSGALWVPCGWCASWASQTGRRKGALSPPTARYIGVRQAVCRSRKSKSSYTAGRPPVPIAIVSRLQRPTTIFLVANFVPSDERLAGVSWGMRRAT